MGQLPDARRAGGTHDEEMAISTDPADAAASAEAFTLSLEAAEFYEAAFVPAFFAQWAPILCDRASVRAGQRVLDVACGTGVVARAAAERAHPRGAVTGVDLNEAMITVARRIRPDLDYRLGDAGALPFPAESFDVVLCQMALMFLPERSRALQEMARVVKTSGTVGVLVPADLASQPVFAPFVAMAGRHAGQEAMSLLTTYFACGNLADLTELFRSAGLEPTSADTVRGMYRAPSVDAFVTTEVESTPLKERISEQTYQAIRADAHPVLAPFTAADGSVRAPFEANIVTARKPGTNDC